MKTPARRIAAQEAVTAFLKATAERRRAQIVAHLQGGHRQDVTEDVVSIMDRLTSTLDWGSGFFDDDDLAAFFRLADLLKIDVPDSVKRPPT